MSNNELLHEKLKYVIENDGEFWGQCAICEFILKKPCLEVGSCTDWIVGLVDEIERKYIPRKEAEDEKRQIIEAQADSAHHIMKLYAESMGKPMRDGDNITKWLDKWFIPRPRFENGEPVEFGCNQLLWDETSPCNTQVPWHFNAIKSNGTPMVTSISEVIAYAAMTDDGFVKRRIEIKVFDADGVEIKPGDTVYRMTDGLELQVKDVYYDDLCGGCFHGEDDDIGMVAIKFTHKKPALDADGVPIKVGDTIWTIDNNPCYAAIVDNVKNDLITVKWSDGERGSNLKGEWFTHEKPDSLDKLIDDMSAYRSDHVLRDSYIDKELKNWIERANDIKDSPVEF